MEKWLPSAEQLARGWRPYLILLLLCSALYLPGLTRLPPTDRDESRFAQASRQMLESGNYVDIRFQQVPRYKKPIGIYWLQAAAAAATVGPESPEIWPYRIPSVVGALLAVLLTFHFGAALFDRPTALIGAALLAGCLLLGVESHLAKTDAMLLAAITAMQGLLGRLYLAARDGREPGRWTALGFWAACGAGTLVKGPVPPAIALLTLVALSLADRSLRPWQLLQWRRGVPLLLAIVLPWLLAISLATKGAFLTTAVGSDLLPKLLGGQESHGAPFGYYLLLFPALFWPGSLFAIWAAWPSWRRRAETGVRFCLSWLIPTWLLFELVPTKLPHYVLPAFPAIALLTGYALCRATDWCGYTERPLLRILRWLPVGLWAAVTLILGLGLTGLPLYLNHQLLPASLIALTGSIGLLFWVRRCWREERLDRAVAGSLLAALLVLPVALSAILPALKGPWLSVQVAQAIERQAPGQHPLVASVGYAEPSLVFLLGTRTQLTNAAGAAAVMAEQPDRFALVAEPHRQAFEAAARANGGLVQPVESLRGFNYSKGKWLTLELYRSLPRP